MALEPRIYATCVDLMSLEDISGLKVASDMVWGIARPGCEI